MRRRSRRSFGKDRQHQNTATAFGGLPTPPITFNGSLLTKKVHLLCFLHCSARSSKSNSSPIGIPKPASMYSCIVMCPGPVGRVALAVKILVAGHVASLFLTPSLKSRTVRRNGGKSRIPQPFQGLQTAVKPRVEIL